MEELSELDRERWWIVAIDVNGLRDRDVYAYAIDRDATGIEEGDLS